MFQSELNIPKDRVPMLIGKKGEIKRKIQQKTKTTVTVSKEGDVFIEGEDNLHVLIVVSVVKAIARGFNPEIAFLLFNEHNVFELVDMTHITKKSKKSLARVKSRLIGTDGKARKTIEKLTGTHIVIYGKTVGIIGEFNNVHIAKKAVERLLQGAKHGNAYNYIQDRLKKETEFA